MLDHVGLRVLDYDRSKAFYAAVLAPLGYQLSVEGPSGAGFGTARIPDFWIKQGEPLVRPASVAPEESAGCGSAPVHVAFVAETRAMVDAFHAAALAAGARDNGAPGVRPEYHRHYYGAFVLDPDGYNVEAVCHGAA